MRSRFYIVAGPDGLPQNPLPAGLSAAGPHPIICCEQYKSTSPVAPLPVLPRPDASAPDTEWFRLRAVHAALMKNSSSSSPRFDTRYAASSSRTAASCYSALQRVQPAEGTLVPVYGPEV